MKPLPPERQALPPVELDPQCADIIEALTALRRRQGISCTQIALAAKIPCSTVGRIERRLHVPTLNTLARYCRACGARLTLAM